MANIQPSPPDISGLGLYIRHIHLEAMVYILHISIYIIYIYISYILYSVSPKNKFKGGGDVYKLLCIRFHTIKFFSSIIK